MFIKRAFPTKSPVPRGTQSPFHARDRRGIRSPNGFTLIEVIVTLVLVGILATAGGMAIVQAIKGYTTTKQNSATTQKAQMAMSRITREIIEMIDIPSGATNTTLPLTGTSNCTGTDCVRTIGLDSGAVKIAFGSSTTLAGGDILIDNVQAFSLTYYKGTTSYPTWPTGNDIDLSTIDVNLTLSQPNGGTLNFTTRVAPRNNGNLGGAPMPTNPGTPAQWNLPTSCFVATAAYGDPGHPMVQILRDFRARYLLSWPGGRWFVKKYYEHGPAAADMIRHRPLAMWAVRCLLAPVVALSFCLMYAPLAIPFILLVSLIVTSALFSAVRRRFIPLNSGVFRARGSILIGLIITMVIMAALGAAMLPLFSASYMNQAYADQGRKAYFLAESGYRYASSQFLWASTDAARDNTIVDLNGGTSGTTSAGKTCNLLNNAGSFNTVVYPLWFYTTSYTSPNLTTHYVGTAPSEITKDTSGGYIMVGTDASPAFYSYTSHSVSGTTITFSGVAYSAPTTSISLSTANVVVRPVALATGGSLSKGGSLLLGATGSGAFPLLNGNFTLVNSSGGQIQSGAIFNYKTRTGNTLYNITLSNSTQNANWTSSVSVPAATNVILSKFLRIDSTGTIGSTSRKVTYNAPIGFLSGGGGGFQKQQYTDPMTNLNDFFTGSGQGLGSHSASGGVLNVTAMNNPTHSSGSLLGLIGWGTANGDLWALIAFNWANTNINLAQSWVDAQGFLSYDIQVKVAETDQAMYQAGINFRSTNNSDDSDFYTYGVSFMKPYAQVGCLLCLLCGGYDISSDVNASLIPGGMSGPLFAGTLESDCNGLVAGSKAKYGLPAIVLWEKTSAGFKWLAYRTLVANDKIVTKNGSAYRLVDWSTLMVRVAEGYSLTFTVGHFDPSGRPIKEGDVITAASGSARVVMTPILNAGSWADGTAAGTLVLANVNGTFSIGDALSVNGVQATAGIYTATKKNYIRVYFTGTAAQGTANSSEIDPTSGTPNRYGQAQGSVNWPPDNLSDLSASTDFFSVVQWTGYNTGIWAMTSTSEPSAIIVNSDLTSPSPACMGTNPFSCTAANFVGPDGTTSADTIGLMTGYNNGTATDYDDFAMQLDLKTGSTGVLSPIQQ